MNYLCAREKGKGKREKGKVINLLFMRIGLLITDYLNRASYLLFTI